MPLRRLCRLLPYLAATLLPLAASGARAQTPDSAAPPKPAATPWYQRLRLRGYTQFRYNDLARTNPALVCEQCDRAIGGTREFSIRRARLVLSGNIADRVFFYLQPDFAQATGGSEHFVQLRDLYADVFVDRPKTLRVRVGLSKVPFGWENIQSSSNRLPFDRSDAINSAAPGERDLGLLAYWTPRAAQARYRFLADSGLKGTGDYGVIGVGVYNGQGANRAEANSAKHVVARVAYPFAVGRRQIVELGLQAYTGIFTVPSSQRTPGVTGPTEFRDQRLGVTGVLYPQPVGLAAEWVWGKGPEYDPAANAITSQHLHGGYVLASYRLPLGGRPLIPYVRGQYYDGGKRQELDARSYRVRELEIGVEWSPLAALEGTIAYTVSERRFEDGVRPDNEEEGQLVRVQLQVNY